MYGMWRQNGGMNPNMTGIQSWRGGSDIYGDPIPRPPMQQTQPSPVTPQQPMMAPWRMGGQHPGMGGPGMGGLGMGYGGWRPPTSSPGAPQIPSIPPGYEKYLRGVEFQGHVPGYQLIQFQGRTYYLPPGVPPPPGYVPPAPIQMRPY